MSLLAQAATQPASEWTPTAVTSLIASLVAGIIAIIGALRAFRADAKASNNDTRINNTVRHMDSLRSDLTNVALRTPTGTGDGNGGPLPGGIVGGNIDRPKGH